MTKQNQELFRTQLQNHIDSMQTSYNNYKGLETAVESDEHKAMYGSIAAGIFTELYNTKALLVKFNDASELKLPFTIKSLRAWIDIESTIQFIVPDGRLFDLSTKIKGTWEEIQSELINLAIDFTGTLLPKLYVSISDTDVVTEEDFAKLKADA